MAFFRGEKAHCTAYEILVPRPRIKPAIPTLEAKSLNHLNASVVQEYTFTINS